MGTARVVVRGGSPHYPTQEERARDVAPLDDEGQTTGSAAGCSFARKAVTGHLDPRQAWLLLSMLPVAQSPHELTLTPGG
jgi:hypothetical protein